MIMSTKPNRVELTLDGRNRLNENQYTIEEGRVKLEVNVGVLENIKLKVRYVLSRRW